MMPFSRDSQGEQMSQSLLVVHVAPPKPSGSDDSAVCNRWKLPRARDLGQGFQQYPDGTSNMAKWPYEAKVERAVILRYLVSYVNCKCLLL